MSQVTNRSTIKSIVSRFEKPANYGLVLIAIFALLLVSGILPEFFHRSFVIVPFIVIIAVPTAAYFLIQFVSGIATSFRPAIPPTQARTEITGR